MDPTYNVALTERQIRALSLISGTFIRSATTGQETRDFYRDIKTTMENRLARIEAEKGAIRGHDARP